MGWIKIRSGLILGIFFVGISACSVGENADQSSTVTGKVTWADEILSLPKAKPAERLLAFGKKLMSYVGTNSLSRSTSNAAKKKIFGGHYLKAVSEADGIPRSQGEKVLKDILAPTNRACGGASCAAVFGVKHNEVQAFLDDLLEDAGTSKELAKPEKKSLRSRIVGSLVPAQAVKNPATPRDYVLGIYQHRPEPTPAEPKPPKEIFSVNEIKGRAGDKFVHLVYDYTSTADYHFIRKVESNPREKLLKDGMSAWELNRWMKSSNILYDGMKKLPTVRGDVYRGMQKLEADDIAEWVRAWREKKVIGLGFGEQPATTSASWSVQAAMKFLDAPVHAGGDSKYAVLLQISNHRGVAIERISDIPAEKEVLLPRDLKVMIESIAPMENHERTFIIKMRGINSAQIIWNHDLSIKLVA